MTQPNVLIVVTDDQALGMMGAMPRTRAWLGTGTNYTNAVASTPLCCPARAQILSGRYVHNHDVRTLDDAYNLDFSKTLPTRLQRAGYTTAMSGKFLNSWQMKDAPPGFDRFAMLGGGYFGIALHTDAETQASLGADAPVSRSERQITTIRDAALSWVDDFETTDEKPWMMYLAPTAPHMSYQDGYGDAPSLPLGAAMRESDLSDKPPHVRDVTRGQHVDGPLGSSWEKAYRTLRPVDDMMSAVRDRLRSTGELETTVVIFTSDNGYLFGQHGLQGKREPYDESLRVPLMLSWPERVEAGTDARITGLVDIAPTVFAAAGITPGYTVDGQSLLAPTSRRRILIEHFGGGAYDHNVGTWAGWWSPDGMYRRSFYGARGSRGCFDNASATLCQRYSQAPGGEELYRDRARLRNVLQHGAVSGAHRGWTTAASQCAGARCRQLEARRPVVAARPWLRVSYLGPVRFTVGAPRTVRVVIRNVSGRRVRNVRARIEGNARWSATLLNRRRVAVLRPGQRLSVRWRLRFKAEGEVSLSTTTWFRAAGERRSWDAAPVQVRR